MASLAPNTSCAKPSQIKARSLMLNFILEIGYGGWESPVQRHVGITLQFEGEFERNRLRECLSVKYTIANKLAAHLGKNKIVTSLQNVYAAHLGFLVKLLCFELGCLGVTLRAGLLKRLFQKHLL